MPPKKKNTKKKPQNLRRVRLVLRGSEENFTKLFCDPKYDSMINKTKDKEKIPATCKKCKDGGGYSLRWRDGCAYSGTEAIRLAKKYDLEIASPKDVRELWKERKQEKREGEEGNGIEEEDGDDDDYDDEEEAEAGDDDDDNEEEEKKAQCRERNFKNIKKALQKKEKELETYKINLEEEMNKNDRLMKICESQEHQIEMLKRTIENEINNSLTNLEEERKKKYRLVQTCKFQAIKIEELVRQNRETDIRLHHFMKRTKMAYNNFRNSFVATPNGPQDIDESSFSIELEPSNEPDRHPQGAGFESPGNDDFDFLDPALIKEFSNGFPNGPEFLGLDQVNVFAKGPLIPPTHEASQNHLDLNSRLQFFHSWSDSNKTESPIRFY